MRITQKHVKRHERRVAEKIGGRRVPFSGAAEVKGDVRVAQSYTKTDQGLQGLVKIPLRIECKWRQSPRYTLNQRDWVKLEQAARAAGETPLFHIKIHDNTGRYVERAVVSYTFYKELGLPDLLPLNMGEPARSVTIAWTLPHCTLVLETPDSVRPLTHVAVTDYATLLNAIQNWSPE